jgi:3-methylfumaryl-CoA hydratase
VTAAEVSHDVAAKAPVTRLAALLDHDPASSSDMVVPPLAHWLYFLPNAAQGDLGEDGHPRRADAFASEFPRRMWAGGRVEFRAPIALGSDLTRETRTITSQRKSGRSGEMVFVTLEHRIHVADTLCIVEEQDIVYRAAAAPSPPVGDAPKPLAASRATRQFVPDEAMLFRYSALTFNAHRIHYDLPYAREVEGYPALVVHGPLIATLLMDTWRRAGPGKTPARFSFRAERPAFVNRVMTLDCEADALTAYSDGIVAMRAEVTP